MRLRTTLWHKIQRRRAPRNVSILSDDCWAGQYYRVLGIPYLTPTIGCWVEPHGYLDLVLDVLSGKPITPVAAPGPDGYPILCAGSARLHFIYDDDAEKTLDTFVRRMQRLQRARLFVKIDLGKGATSLEVSRWNQLALPNSVALYPRGSPLADGVPIHHGVAIDDWNMDGAKMYEISQRYFDVVRWLKTGRPETEGLYARLPRILTPGPRGGHQLP